MVNSVTGNISGHKSSPEESREHELPLDAKRITEIPSNLQMRIDYNLDRTSKTVGYAPKGLLVSQTGWLLQRLNYSLASFPSQVSERLIAYDSWDNKDAASYS